MTEHPFSRIEFKILCIVAIFAVSTAFACYISFRNAEQHKAAMLPAKPVVTSTSKGWHLLKMQQGNEQILVLVDCYKNDNCITAGYHWDANDPNEVANAEKMYDRLANPPPPPKLLLVIH